MHHSTAKASPISNLSGSLKLTPPRKTSIPSRGYSKFISFPTSELKTTYAPIGKDSSIIPKITDTSAEYGIARTLRKLSLFSKASLMHFYT
jgi:hypothetical protein